MIKAEAHIKWTAQLDHVVEVSLFGYADLDYWQRKLALENLLPIERENKATVLIITGDARFRGVRFKEISVSILTRRPDNPTEGAFLMQAWNSSRFFSWCERTFFKTPYAHAQIDISAAEPTHIHLSSKGQMIFRAQFHSSADSPRQPTTESPGGWSGPIYIPSRKPSTKPSYYFARLQGHTETYPFLLDTDALTINATSRSWSLQSLLDSRFTPERWELRRNAIHARSKTFTQGRALDSL